MLKSSREKEKNKAQSGRETYREGRMERGREGTGLGCGSGRGREKEGPALKKVGKTYRQASPQQRSLLPPAGSAGNWELGTGNWCFCPELLFHNTEKTATWRKGSKKLNSLVGNLIHLLLLISDGSRVGWMEVASIH